MATPTREEIAEMDAYEQAYWLDYIERHNRRERRRGHPGQRRYIRDNPKKSAARMAVQGALQSGKLVKPSACEACHGEFELPMLHGHHDDYDNPLDVRWLCAQCHKDWHRDNGPGLNAEENEMGMLDRFERFADKTFADAAELYLTEFDGKCKTRQEYALKHVMPYIGHLPLIEVDDQALAQYKADRKMVVMAGTINKELSTTTAILNKAARVWRWIPSAPKLQRVRGVHRKPYPLSFAEQRAMFGCLDGNLQKICLFAINTGVRREEIFKLRWEDERDVDGVMVFILRDTKNGEDRPVICNSIARRIVEYMRKPCIYVPNDKKQLSNFARSDEFVFPEQAISKPLEQAWLMAGLPDDRNIKKGPHNFRHTFGYRLRAEGVSGEDRDSLLGHHARSLTQHYAVPDIARLAALAERVTVPRQAAVLR